MWQCGGASHAVLWNLPCIGDSRNSVEGAGILWVRIVVVGIVFCDLLAVCIIQTIKEPNNHPFQRRRSHFDHPPSPQGTCVPQEVNMLL